MDFQASQLQSTETTMPMPLKKKRKSNLEEDLLAGGTDVGRTGYHGDCGCSSLFWSTDTINAMPIKKKRK